MRVLRATVVGGVFGALGGMLLLWLLDIVVQLIIPLLVPVTLEDFLRQLLSTLVAPFRNPLLFDPSTGLISGIAIGVIASIRASSTKILIARSILGGISAKLARLIYFTRMPSPSPSEFASLVLIGIGVAFLDLLVGGGFRFILRQLKNKSS
jgi:hypothetical protein